MASGIRAGNLLYTPMTAGDTMPSPGKAACNGAAGGEGADGLDTGV